MSVWDERRETNRSILAIARAKILPEALQTGRDIIYAIPIDDSDDDEDDDKKEKQLQGKMKINFIMRKMRLHHNKMTEFVTRKYDNAKLYGMVRHRVQEKLS